MITEEYVRSVFKGLESGDGASFFEHVADDVDWTVEGTHPLAGHYKSKALRLRSSTEVLFPSQWSFIPWRRPRTV